MSYIYSIFLNSLFLRIDLVMFVKNTLEEVVSVVVELCGAVWRDLYSAIRGRTESTTQIEKI